VLLLLLQVEQAAVQLEGDESCRPRLPEALTALLIAKGIITPEVTLTPSVTTATSCAMTNCDGGSGCATTPRLCRLCVTVLLASLPPGAESVTESVTCCPTFVLIGDC
jgi:hypothetical protein